MRLLSSTLLLLSFVSPSLGERRTTIEYIEELVTRTVEELVTRTVIHEVTDAPTPATSVEVIWDNVTRTIVHEVPTTTTPRPTSIEVVWDNVTRTVIHEVPTTTTAAPETTIEVVWNNVTRTIVHTVPTTPAAAPIVGISGQTRQCTCAETDACREESLEGLNDCYAECDEHLEGYGNETEKYVECFSKNNATIVEAQSCIFKDLNGTHCTTSNETNFITKSTKWDEIASIEYSPETNSTIKDNFYWKKHGEKYTNFQKFFHCTKHCTRNKLNTCTKTKGCAITLPEPETFKTMMHKCIKGNPKITQAIFSTCQCLAWANGVKDHRGACIVIGNQYYVDKA